MVILIINDPSDPMAQAKGIDAERFIKKLFKRATIIHQLYSTNDKEYVIFNAALMYDCDAVFLLNNWMDSVPAMKLSRLAHDIGMKVITAPDDEWNDYAEIISGVSVAIEKAIGVSFDSFTSKSRNRKLYFARLIFSSICTMNGIPLSVIEDILNRHKSTVSRLPLTVRNELNLNKEFSSLHRMAEEAYKDGLLTDFALEKYWKGRIHQAVMKKGVKMYQCST